MELLRARENMYSRPDYENFGGYANFGGYGTVSYEAEKPLV